MLRKCKQNVKLFSGSKNVNFLRENRFFFLHFPLSSIIKLYIREISGVRAATDFRILNANYHFFEFYNFVSSTAVVYQYNKLLYLSLPQEEDTASPINAALDSWEDGGRMRNNFRNGPCLKKIETLHLF